MNEIHKIWNKLVDIILNLLDILNLRNFFQEKLKIKAIHTGLAPKIRKLYPNIN